MKFSVIFHMDGSNFRISFRLLRLFTDCLSIPCEPKNWNRPYSYMIDSPTNPPVVKNLEFLMIQAL